MRRNGLMSGIFAAALLGCAMVSVGASAQSPAEAVTARQTIMKENGAAVYRTLRQYVQNNAGTMDDVKKAAETVATNAEKIPTLFPKGTEAGVAGSKTKADLWEQPDRFARLSTEFKQAAQTLVAAARAGDADRVKASFGGVLGSCNACHDAYQIR